MSVDFVRRKLPLLDSPVGSASLVKPLGTDGSFEDDFLDNDFVKDIDAAIDVSPTIEPERSPDNLVTRAPSSTKLLDFLKSDAGLVADDFRFTDADSSLATASVLLSSSSVNVEARRNAGGVVEEPTSAIGSDAETCNKDIHCLNTWMIESFTIRYLERKDNTALFIVLPLMYNISVLNNVYNSKREINTA